MIDLRAQAHRVPLDSDKDWTAEDLRVLEDGIRRGDPIDELAGFLSRTLAEVEEIVQALSLAERHQ
jgi:hypothetical protein